MCNRLPEIKKNGDAGIFPVYYSLKDLPVSSRFTPSECLSLKFSTLTARQPMAEFYFLTAHSHAFRAYIFWWKTVSYEEFFQEILGLEGSKISWGKKNVSYEEIFRKFGSNSPRRGNFEAQNFLETTGNFTRKFWDHLIIELNSVPFSSTG